MDAPPPECTSPEEAVEQRSVAPRRPRRTMIVAFVVVAIVSAGFAVKSIWLTDSTTMVSVDDAVDRFRSETTAPGTTPAHESTPLALPAPGVYRYVTTGGESIDAMGGVDRPYPTETTITVTPDGCGVRLDWIALEERREVWALCLADGSVTLQPEATQFHEFFGQAQLDEVLCDRSAELITTTSAPPRPLDLACTLEGEPWTPTWTVIERTSRPVGGIDIDVIHVRMTVDDADEYWEDTTVDWYLAESGLPVAVIAETASRSPSVVGAVVYEEAYALELQSLIPLT